MLGWGKPRFIQYQVVGRRLILKLAYFRGEVWLTQKQIAKILGLRIPTINEHLKKILACTRNPDKVVRPFTIKAEDGKRYEVKHYRFNLLQEIQDRVKD